MVEACLLSVSPENKFLSTVEDSSSLVYSLILSNHNLVWFSLVSLSLVWFGRFCCLI